MIIFSILALLIPALPPFILLNGFFPRSKPLFIIPLSWLIGNIVFTQTLFISNVFFKIPLTFTTGWLIIFVLSLFAGLVKLLLNKLISNSKPQQFVKNKRRFLDYMVVVPGLILITVFIISFWFPVTDWDAVILFDYRAKVTLVSQNYPLKSVWDTAMYPPLTSLLHWWAYLNKNVSPMPLYQLFLDCFLLVSYYLLRLRFSHNMSLAGVLLLLCTPKLFDQSFVAYTNLPYVIYLITGTAFIFDWKYSNRRISLLMGIIFSLSSLWVRGFPFALVNFYLIISIFLSRPYIYKAVIGTVGLLSLFIFIVKSHPFIGVIHYVYNSVINYYQPLFLIILAAIFIKYRTRTKYWYWPNVVFGYLAILFFGTFFQALLNPAWYLQTDAIQRMSIFFGPVCIWLVTETLSESGSNQAL